ncbi:Spy/CpxP family protein refolding chaperone [Variovorax sp. UC122_21]|uniref:Spy/CpxP family protein refolding chaperone n=1 Tax=Variovorax sp. UC122_21 TaxID=3374554 RepID=UPI0037580287
MISLRQRILWAGLLGSAALASSGAFAQTPSPTTAAPTAAVAQADGTAPQRKAHAEHKRMDPAKRLERMQEHRAKRLAALKDKLKLNASQESAWSSYTSATQPPGPRPDGQRMTRADFAKLTTPQRIERMQARQAERSAMFAKRADATKSFYAALTPEQQKTFDAESMHFGGHRFHRGGHHGGPDAQPAKG